MSRPTLDTGTDNTDDFASFAAVLARQLGIEPDAASGWSQADRLDQCLMWDSLAVAETVEWLDAQGVVLPEDLLPELITIGDLYHYARAPGPRSSPPGRRLPGRVLLEPLSAADEAAAFWLMSRGEHLTRFRLRGTTPSPETFHHQLWDRVLVQFAVRSSPGGPLAGLITAFDPDLRNRHVHLAAVASEAAAGTGLVASAVMDTVDYLFREFDLRKIYAEALAVNAEQFRSGLGRYFDVQGRLTGHEYIGGRYEDVFIYATTRAVWVALRQR